MPGFMYPCVALFYGYYWPRSCDGLLKKDKKEAWRNPSLSRI